MESVGAAGEADPLLESTGRTLDGDLLEVVAEQKTFPLIHLIRNDVKRTIDTALTWDELTGVDLNFSIVRPLAVQYSRFNSLAIIYVLLLNKIQFDYESERDLAFQSVNSTRAALCELLAIKLLRTFSTDGLELITALTASFSPFMGATPSTLEDLGVDPSSPSVLQQSSSALELAIYSQSKRFIRSPLCQRCVDGIWTGHITLSIYGQHAIVGDTYKKRPLAIYDPTSAPILDHRRLRVPQIRARLEFCNFCLLLVFFVLCLQQKTSPVWTFWETIFTIWLFGFALDELASLKEHGLDVYSSSIFNILDAVFCIIGFVWLAIRTHALVLHSPHSNFAFDVLALGAVLLCPRVASALLQDNIVLLALRAMFKDFSIFMLLATVCFSGFAYAFWSLADNNEWSFGRIVWLMLKVWFGNNYVGFDTSQSFSPVLGPPLMIAFAVLSNTLLLTVLISLLSNTFSLVSLNAAEEVAYQHACKTLAGVTTDALFSYVPPLNLLGFAIILPLSFVLSPRYLHKTNVFLIRLTSFPILLAIRYFSSHNRLRTGMDLGTRASEALRWRPGKRTPEGEDVEMIFGREISNDEAMAAWEGKEWIPLEDGGASQTADTNGASKSGDTNVEAELLVDVSEAEAAGVGYGSLTSDPASTVRTQQDSSADAVPASVSNDSQPSRSSDADTASNSNSQLMTPTRRPQPASRSQDSPQTPTRAKAKTRASRTADDGFVRGLGSLSSPLARLFGANARSSPPSASQGLEPSAQQQLRRTGAAFHDALAISQNTFRDDAEHSADRAETDDVTTVPHASEAAVPNELMARLEALEKTNERIEALLGKLLEAKFSSYAAEGV